MLASFKKLSFAQLRLRWWEVTLLSPQQHKDLKVYAMTAAIIVVILMAGLSVRPTPVEPEYTKVERALLTTLIKETR